MPMYRYKQVEEYRCATGDNNVDIAMWAGWDEDDIITGNYYDLYGGEYSPEEFHELYEPAEG